MRLYEAGDRLSRIEGHKYIILIAPGRDTMSKLTLDKILQKVKAMQDITIFTISTGGALRAMTEGRGGSGGRRCATWTTLQAENQMKTFAKMTGGDDFPAVCGRDAGDIRGDQQEYPRRSTSWCITPPNAKQDGTYRKLRVELVDEEGKPLRFQDEKHKPLKYDIIARDGYRARQEVE